VHKVGKQDYIPEGKRHLEDVGIYDRITIKWILKK
jgi:hypothetical protein